MNKLPLCCLMAALLFTACGGASTPRSTALPTDSPTPLPTETSTPSPSPTCTPTPTTEPEWALPLDADYSIMKYRYGLVQDPQTKVYVSLEDAAAANGNFGLMSEAPSYIYINGEGTADGQTWFGTRLGWIAAGDVSLVTPSSLRGILLTREVDFRFGWVLVDDQQSTNAAGTPIRSFLRYTLVHEVPAVTENPGFFAVGADEWLPLDALALTDAALPADVNPGMCRFIYVDLSAQTLRVYQDCRLIFVTLVSTGEDPRWTLPGEYTILNKYDYTKLAPPQGSISAYSLEGVPYFMSYAGDWGFHTAYWHDSFGKPVSHGCVNLSPADARWLYEWAILGERVIITRP